MDVKLLEGEEVPAALEYIEELEETDEEVIVIAAVIHPIMKTKFLCLLKVYSSKFEKIFRFLFRKFKTMLQSSKRFIFYNKFITSQKTSFMT